MKSLGAWWKWYWQLNRLNKVYVVAAFLAILSFFFTSVYSIWQTFFVDKTIKLAFEPQVTFETLDQGSGSQLQYYNFRFVVRNSGKNTVDKFYYKFVFPSETVIPTHQRFGMGDRSLWLDSKMEMRSANGKTYYTLGGIHNSPLFPGRSMNLGNLSLMEPLKDFNVGWQFSWEGGTFPEGGKELGVMKIENGALKVEPPFRNNIFPFSFSSR